MRRLRPEDDHITYPLIHARADGTPIKEISNEWLVGETDEKVPRLRAYLKSIDATITVNGARFP